MFAKDLDTRLPCDAKGQPFPAATAATCLVFDSLDEARRFSEAQVLETEQIQFEVFDAQGRSNPPLLTILHPQRAAKQDAHPRTLRRRRTVAWSLIAGGVPLLFLSYWLNQFGHAIFPGFIGLNMVLAGGRLLWFNLALTEAERTRQERVDKL